jgi:DNA-cytosine methyltransferase
VNVLSLFDGMSCAQIALNRAGIPYANYFASEIDKYAISITQKNYPKTIQLGCIKKIKSTHLPKIDLLIGGSPCQGFSFAGKRLNFKDPRSALFFEYVRLLKELKPKHFLLENVKMKKESENVISKHLGVTPIEINSSLVSAQNRRRLYWCNWNFFPPKDKQIFWCNIQENSAKNVYYVTEKMNQWINKNPKRKNKHKVYKSDLKEKMQMIEASHHKGISNQRNFSILDNGKRRYISVIECERLQTVPKNYTEGVSNTRRYQMLGNGMTVDVIVHILNSSFSNC